jgi:hypothetical protein
MTKKFLSLLSLSNVFLASCNQDNHEDITIDSSKTSALSAERINTSIDESISIKNTFDWSHVDDHFLWSAIKRGNNIATIGFGTSKNDYDRSKSPDNQKIEQEILNIIQHYEGKLLDKIVISSDKFLNLVDVIIEKQETVIALRKSQYIRYFEPSDYKYFQNNASYRASNADGSSNTTNSSGSSGCGYESEVLNTADFTTVLPNAKAPWTFYKHNIPAAWSFSSGAGVTIGVVDTGISPSQSLFGSSFNNGFSTGRTVYKYGTYVDSIWPWTNFQRPNARPF